MARSRSCIRARQPLERWRRERARDDHTGGIELHTEDVVRAGPFRVSLLGHAVEVRVEHPRLDRIPREEAREVLESRSFAANVDSDWRRSSELGVTGVPTFVINGRGVVGAQPYDVLEELVTESGAERRPGSNTEKH